MQVTHCCPLKAAATAVSKLQLLLCIALCCATTLNETIVSSLHAVLSAALLQPWPHACRLCRKVAGVRRRLHQPACAIGCLQHDRRHLCDAEM